MKLYFVSGRTRHAAAYLWLAFILWVSIHWLGLIGVGLTCIAASNWLRQDVWSRAPRSFSCDADDLSEVWCVPLAICVHAGGRKQWLCRDECPPAQWAALLRYLRLHGPRQAVGLSMSR